MPWYKPAPLGPEWSEDLVCGWTAETVGQHRLIPDGCVDLLWTNDGSLWVCGPETQPWSFTLPPGTQAAGVRFRPGAAPAALHVDADQVRDVRVRLEDLLGSEAGGRLADRVGDQATPAARMRVLRDAAHGLVSKSSRTDPLVRHLRTTLALGSPAVGGLAEDAGLTSRQLHRRCTAAFGYGPAMLRRILRLQRFLALARRAPAGSSLAHLAHMAGYSDQAHLSRDCRALAGSTPSTLLASQAPDWHGSGTPVPLPTPPDDVRSLQDTLGWRRDPAVHD